MKWFARAAEQNHAQAQYNLGVCYWLGNGVQKDKVESYKWWLLAAAQGVDQAKASVPMQERTMAQEQVAEGKRRAEEWLEQRKRPPGCPSLSGTGVGTAVTPGTGKVIAWDAGTDWNGQ